MLLVMVLPCLQEPLVVIAMTAATTVMAIGTVTEIAEPRAAREVVAKVLIEVVAVSVIATEIATEIATATHPLGPLSAEVSSYKLLMVTITTLSQPWLQEDFKCLLT
jgi:hypothetical protein